MQIRDKGFYNYVIVLCKIVQCSWLKIEEGVQYQSSLKI